MAPLYNPASAEVYEHSNQYIHKTDSVFFLQFKSQVSTADNTEVQLQLRKKKKLAVPQHLAIGSQPTIMASQRLFVL